MALGFARVQFIQRSKGHSSLKRLAYNERRALRCERSGQSFDYSDRGSLLESATLLPAGAPSELTDARALWQRNEFANRRVRASLGLELMLLLPHPFELAPSISSVMVRDFVSRTIVDAHGLGATVSIHHPHVDLDGEDRVLEVESFFDDDATARELVGSSMVNLHAHVLITPRKVEAGGLAKKRYTALDPVHRPITLGCDWQRLWTLFQNQRFAELGLDLRVTPNPPVSLGMVPLKDVRRFRARLKRKGGTSNSDNVVDPGRERANRAILSNLEAGLDVISSPFTTGDLRGLYERHFDKATAHQLTGAALLSEAVVALGNKGPSAIWYASHDAVITELSAFGRALALAQRNSDRPEGGPALGSGFSDATRATLSAILNAPDIVMLEAAAPPDILKDDLARTVERAGGVPVTIATPAGHPPPKSVVRTIDDIKTKLVTGATLIVDDVDSFNAVELEIILAATQVGLNRLVLIRRTNSVWPRHSLVDLISRHVPVVRWPVREHPKSSLSHLKAGDIGAAVEMLFQEGAISYHMTDRSALASALSEVMARTDRGEKCALLIANPDRLALAKSVATRHGTEICIVSASRETLNHAIVVPVIAGNLAGGQLAAAMTHAGSLELIVSSEQAGDLDDLKHLLGQQFPARCAITLSPFWQEQSQTSSLWPRFAIDLEGDVVVRPHAIAASIRLWSAAPEIVTWMHRDFDMQDESERLSVALQPMLGRPSKTDQSRRFSPIGVGTAEISINVFVDHYLEEVEAFSMLEDDFAAEDEADADASLVDADDWFEDSFDEHDTATSEEFSEWSKDD